ncbi:MAG: PDZ domain-containing protein [Luteolibacter sp.]
MKTGFTIFSATGIAGSLTIFGFTAVQAIEPPPDESRPPAALLGDTRESTGADELPAPRENIAFLGIATAAVPDMVSDHLGLAAGTGVIIRTVCPDSPAEKAGLSVNDIITAINGTPIDNPDQFSQSIASRKIGERIAMDLIHKGNAAKVEVTLVGRPADLISGVEQEPFLDGLPKAHADRLRGLLEQNLRSFGDGFNIPDLEAMREQLRNGLDNNSGDTPGFGMNSTIRLMDQEGSVEIKSNNGSTHVIVRDTENIKIWEGPWDNEQDKAAAPEHIRTRIEKMGAGNGFNFRFGTFGD